MIDFSFFTKVNHLNRNITENVMGGKCIKVERVLQKTCNEMDIYVVTEEVIYVITSRAIHNLNFNFKH